MTQEPAADTRSLFVGLAAVTRMIRARDRLSQAELARRAGVTATFISNVENARANPNLAHIDRLARALGLSGAPKLLIRADDAARRIADATIRAAG